ncbi:MAG: flagellar hook assembly protein FlgD [Alphaproteobacteria bacterium]
MTSDLSINTALNQQNQTSNSRNSLTKDFDQFLQLLTVQLQHQDPLSPMDTTEFTNQLVAFSGVEQQININSKLDSLVALSVGNSFSAALGYVGLDASYVSSEFHFDGAKPVEMKYAINGEAVKAKINIFNEEGELVYSKDTAALDATNNAFVWDGKNSQGTTVPAGTYEIKVDAFDAEDKIVTTTTVVSGHIRGIETQNGQIFVLIGDRAVSTGNILNTTQPEPVTPPAEDEEDA